MYIASSCIFSLLLVIKIHHSNIFNLYIYSFSQVKEYSESTAKDTKDLQEELTKKSELIRELEQLENDSKSKCKDLQQKLQNITGEKDCMEKKLHEDLKSERVNVEALQKELETKKQEIIRFVKIA